MVWSQKRSTLKYAKNHDFIGISGPLFTFCLLFLFKKFGIYKKLSYICRKRTTRHQLQNTIIDNIIPLKKGTLILKNSQMNIGHKIREVLDAQHRTPLWMADRMGRSKASVYDFFRKKSINTGILVEICHLLHHDFFADISEATKRKRAIKLIPQRKTKWFIDQICIHLVYISQNEYTFMHLMQIILRTFAANMI